MSGPSHRPSPNGANGGRDPSSGRFAAGNRGGPGNPHAQRVGELRSAMFDAVSDDDIREVIGAIVAKAKGGDVVAARLVLDYTIGKPRELAEGPKMRPLQIVCHSDQEREFMEDLSDITGGVTPTPKQVLEALDHIPIPDWAKPDYNGKPDGPDLGIGPDS